MSNRRGFVEASVYLGASFLLGCGGGDDEYSLPGDKREMDLPPVPIPKNVSAIGKNALAWANEREAVLNYSHLPSWIYYTDKTATRWYISQISAFNRSVGVYSLGSMVDNEVAWWTVSTTGLTGLAGTNQLTTTGNFDSIISDTFYDIGRKVSVTNPLIHSDRQLIQNSNISCKWYFFQAPNGYWYILNEPSNGGTNPPIVYRFSVKDGDYYWMSIDMTGVQSIVSWSGGQPKILFSPIHGYVVENNGQSRDMDEAYGAQCVDLMRHYISYALGCGYPHGFTGYDKTAFSIYSDAAISTSKKSSKFGTVIFDKITNTPSGVPSPGDIVFWGRSASNGAGHVAIVISADADGFQSIDQNWVNPSLNGSPAAIVNHNYNNVVGWLHVSW